MPKPSQLFQGIGHHMSRVQLMSNCSHQDSWKVFLERSGGLEGAGKAPSSQLPVKKRGGFCRCSTLIKLGISHVPQNPISRGGRSGGWLMYFVSFLYIQPRKLGDNDPISRAYFVYICPRGLKPSNFRRFWHAHHGYVLKWCLKIPLSHEDIQLLGNFTAMLCWWDVLLLRHTRCRISTDVINHQIPGKPIVYHFCWKLWLGLGVSSWWKFNSNRLELPGINFVDFGRNMLQLSDLFHSQTVLFREHATMVNYGQPAAQEFYRLLFEKEPDLKKLCLGFLRQVYKNISKNPLWKSML